MTIVASPLKNINAIGHLLNRIAHDPRLAYYFDPVTQSMEELTAQYALEYGIDVEKFRKEYYAKLQFERPTCRRCERKDCEATR